MNWATPILEILNFIFSSFWVWLGCALMLSMICGSIYRAIIHASRKEIK